MVVHGMSCPLCANNVDKTLAAVPGVTSVLVDMGSGRAAVTLDGTTKVTRGQLAKAVDKSGFTLKSIEIP
jgi:Cu+-exporting ATPase